MPGSYVQQGDPVLDIRVGIHILTICAPDEGKILRWRSINEQVVPGDAVVEVTGVGTPT